MKLGILGTGKIVKEALPMLASQGYDKMFLLGTTHSREKTQNLAETYHLDGYFFDYDELLAADVDTIYVALPNDLHYAFAKQALLAGKHVIIEKPITVEPEELYELEALAKDKNLILVEAMTTHYMPAFQAIREELPEIGDIKLVNFSFCQYSSRYDNFRKGIISPSFDPAHAGGALMDINVYNVHAILGLFGRPEQFVYFPNMERGVDTSGMLLFTYPGFQAVLVAAKDCEAPVCSQIQGTKSCIRITDKFNQVEGFEVVDHEGKSKLRDYREGIFRMTYEFQVFDKMIAELDFTRAQQMMEISRVSVEILDAVRKGIR